MSLKFHIFLSLAGYAVIVSCVEISNPGELISQLLTGQTNQDATLLPRQNLGAYARKPHQPAPPPRQSYAQLEQWPEETQAAQKRPQYAQQIAQQPPSDENYGAPLVDEQPEINNAYQPAPKPTAAPYQQSPAAKPASYDPTPYADTLYCLDCQDKCGLQLAPQCPTGRGWYKHGDSCYYFEPSIQLAWREARGFCAGLTDETGQQRGHLAIINDARENEYLRSLHHYLQLGGFPTMFWIDLATTNVMLNSSADMMAATAANNTGNATTCNSTALPAVEWFTYLANGFVSSFRSMFNTFCTSTGSCGLVEYFDRNAIEAKRLQSELYWGLDDCASQRPPLCEIDLDGNPFN